jgi:hypothetical protein
MNFSRWARQRTPLKIPKFLRSTEYRRRVETLKNLSAYRLVEEIFLNPVVSISHLSKKTWRSIVKQAFSNRAGNPQGGHGKENKLL